MGHFTLAEMRPIIRPGSVLMPDLTRHKAGLPILHVRILKIVKTKASESRLVLCVKTQTSQRVFTRKLFGTRRTPSSALWAVRLKLRTGVSSGPPPASLGKRGCWLCNRELRMVAESVHQSGTMSAQMPQAISGALCVQAFSRQAVATSAWCCPCCGHRHAAQGGGL